MGFLHERFDQLKFATALDLFSGSATVSLLLRSMNKVVTANDYLPFNQNTASLFLTLTPSDLPARKEAESELRALLEGPFDQPPLVSNGFSGIYFTDPENEQIDRFCQNVTNMTEFNRMLYVYAVGQALLMKRPFSLFHRKNLNLRFGDVTRSFGNKTTWEKPIIEHALNVIDDLRKFDWTGPAGDARCVNSNALEPLGEYDLVYIDPPYISGTGTATNYGDFYHFLNGLVDYSLFGNTDLTKKHNPLLAPASAWTTPASALAEVCTYMEKWPTAVLAFSYRDNGLPAISELSDILGRDRHCSVHECAISYSWATTPAKEVLFLSQPNLTC